MLMTVAVLLVAFLVLLTIRTAVVRRDIRLARSTGRWPRPRRRRRRRRRGNNEAEGDEGEEGRIRTLVVLGSGGHTTEMLALIAPLQHPRTAQHEQHGEKETAGTSSSRQPPPSCHFEFLYCKASTDTTSAQRIPGGISSPSSSSHAPPPLFNIPRSREVGQSYVTSIFTTAYAFASSLWLVLRLRPEMILCNGPGTCLPVCAAVLAMRVAGILRNCPIVFVESLCRVKTLSLTGRILYPWADLFAVHWPDLRTKYPDTVVLESFIIHRQRGGGDGASNG